MRTHIIFIFTLGLSVNAIAINPDRNYNLTPDEIGWNYEELRIKTADGLELNA